LTARVEKPWSLRLRCLRRRISTQGDREDKRLRDTTLISLDVLCIESQSKPAEAKRTANTKFWILGAIA
jgi:hypothetical protein